MYRYETMDKYLNDVSSNTPTPGGGSVSALVGALGSSLASMTANFTLEKEGFKGVEPQINEMLEKCRNGREELLRLMEEDIKAYNGVSKAYSLPKSTEDEMKRRSSAIQFAFEKAMGVPLMVMKSTLSLLEYTNSLIKIANPSLITDAGVAGLLADAALRGAMLNVEINLNYIKNKEITSNAEKEVEKYLKRAEQLIDEIMKKVKDTISRPR